MSKVFYQLSNQGGLPSSFPLAAYGSLQLPLVALSGEKTRWGQTGLAVSTHSCAAVHSRCVLHGGWERSRTSWSLPTERALGAAGGTREHPCLGGPPLPTMQPWQTRGLCSPLLSWLGGLCGHHVQLHSPTVGFFFQNRVLHSQIKSSFFHSPPLFATCRAA